MKNSESAGDLPANCPCKALVRTARVARGDSLPSGARPGAARWGQSLSSTPGRRRPGAELTVSAPAVAWAGLPSAAWRNTRHTSSSFLFVLLFIFKTTEGSPPAIQPRSQVLAGIPALGSLQSSGPWAWSQRPRPADTRPATPGGQPGRGAPRGRQRGCPRLSGATANLRDRTVADVTEADRPP